MVLLFTSLYMVKDLHFSIARAGIIMSFFGIGSVLGSYVGGWLTDRRNYFDIMIFSLLSSGFILLFLLFVSSQYSLSLVIFLYAFTSDMFRPANASAIAAYSTPENRTRSLSLVRLAINLGFSVGPATGGFVALYLGYKWLFVIDSLTSFAAAGMLFFYLPRMASVKNRGESKVLDDKNTSAYRDKLYLVFIFLVALYGICFFQIFASVPQYFSRVCNFNEDTIGLLLALNGFLVVLFEMPLVTSLEKRKKIFPFIIAGALFLPVSFLVLGIGGGLLVWAIVFIITMTLAEMFAMPFMMNFALSRPLKERQGQYSALYSIAFGIANIVAPSLGLGIADRFGFDRMFYFFILLGVITSVGFWMLKKSK